MTVDLEQLRGTLRDVQSDIRQMKRKMNRLRHACWVHGESMKVNSFRRAHFGPLEGHINNAYDTLDRAITMLPKSRDEQCNEVLNQMDTLRNRLQNAGLRPTSWILGKHEFELVTDPDAASEPGLHRLTSSNECYYYGTRVIKDDDREEGIIVTVEPYTR